MIRDHLYEWRVDHPAKNLQEYYDSIEKLPEADRECAAALWGIRCKQDILTVITAFAHLERWKQSFPVVPEDSNTCGSEPMRIDP